jgi:enoyl-CoA hydratase/carnithine racemase
MPIRYEVVDHVARFTIEGATPKNAITPEMHNDFYEHLLQFRDDEDAWVGIFEGAGEECFSVGGDLKRLGALDQDWGRDEAQLFWYPMKAPHHNSGVAIRAWSVEVTKPIIAAVRGFCLGAAFVYVGAYADVRFATPDAKFALPVVRWATPGMGVTARLHQSLPQPIAMHMMLSGEPIDAEEAYRVGLINQIVANDALSATAEAYARKLTLFHPYALMVQKESFLRAREMDRSNGVRYERSQQMFFRSAHHDAFTEGLAAFAEKRRPKYIDDPSPT